VCPNKNDFKLVVQINSSLPTNTPKKTVVGVLDFCQITRFYELLVETKSNTLSVYFDSELEQIMLTVIHIMCSHYLN
jgi:hypothetical protein